MDSPDGPSSVPPTPRPLENVSLSIEQLSVFRSAFPLGTRLFLIVGGWIYLVFTRFWTAVELRWPEK